MIEFCSIIDYIGADLSSTLDFYRLVRISLAKRYMAKFLTATAIKERGQQLLASIFTPQVSYAIA